MALIGVKFCMMVHIGTGQVFFPFGAVPQRIPKIENFGPLKSNISKTAVLHVN